MTPKERAAMQQALEALETDEQWGFVNKKVLERRLPAIAALREALAEQAEQKPVAQVVKSCKTFNVYEAIVDTGNKLLAADTKLYTAPVRTKDLTDDEIWKVIDAVNPSAHIEDLNPLSLCRAVIAADRRKNK